MRHYISLLVLAALFAAAPMFGRADDSAADARGRRAKAALALAGTTPVLSAEANGLCRMDADRARAEAKATGRVVVNFVGDCGCHGGDVVAVGAVPVRVPNYAADDIEPAETPRVVVVYYRSGEAVPMTLPDKSSSETIVRAVKAAQVKAAAPK